MKNLPDTRRPELLVGFETSDDAAVYNLGTQAVISTADFITPVINDPYTFGAIAAANSISDVYAMGGTPIMAINLCGYPQDQLPAQVIGEILAGAADKCKEAGVTVGGGHTVRDNEVKFGLSVTGIISPEKVLRNNTALPGDKLVLTKPLGTGALAALHKQDGLPETDSRYEALIECMTGLNSVGTLLYDLGATACTDVTGFGLSGHSLEMAKGSNVTLIIDTKKLPCLPDAVELCATGYTCGGTKANAGFAGNNISFDASVSEGMIGLVNDPQTSGGLLVSVPADKCDELCKSILENNALSAEVIGSVNEYTDTFVQLF